jgi:hypothetical protein
MSGDWIKMRNDLAEDPAVMQVADRLGLSDFEVVGRMHALWAWTDRQTTDGFLEGVTARRVDQKLQCEGFAAALQDAGWLHIQDDGVQIPDFHKHNGQSAKARSLAAQRQERKRAAPEAADPTAAGEHARARVSRPERGIAVCGGHEEVAPLSRCERDNSVTREEKKKEEKKSTPKSGRAAAAGVDVKDLELPQWLLREDWERLCEYRANRNNPITPATGPLVIQELQSFHGRGVPVRAVIDHTLASGFLALAAPHSLGAAGCAGGTRAGSDPALAKITADRLLAVPPPPDVRSKMASMIGKAQAAAANAATSADSETAP